MTGSINSYTPNFRFKKINFNIGPWHDLEWSNWAEVDALLYTYLNISNVQGIWQNTTAYTVGQRVIDDANGRILQCQVNHTSASAPNTLADDIAAHPTYWQNIGILPKSRGAWAAGTLYSSNDYVSNGYKYAVCLQDHTSGADFDADVTTGYWSVLCDFSTHIATAQTAATNAANSATAAATSATNALSYKDAALTSANAAAASEENTLAYKNAALLAANAAALSETNAGTAQVAAANSANAAATSETNALSYKNTAQSASSTAQTAANTATTKAAEAAASAASISAPSMVGNAGKYMRVKATEDGFEFAAVTQGSGFDYNSLINAARLLTTVSPYALLINGAADAFNDTSGIASFSGLAYDAVNKLFSNVDQLDPFWKNCTALFRFNGNVTDSSGNALTATATNISYSTSVKKFGTHSAQFDGSSSYVTVASPGNAAKLTGDLTIDVWVYPTASSATEYAIFSNRSNGSSTTGCQLYINSGSLYFNVGGTGVLSGGTIPTNTWTHIAVTRSGSTFTGWVNGVAVATGTNSNSLTDGALYIGRDAAAAQHFYPGYMDDFRITSGVARFASNFTVPASEAYAGGDTLADVFWPLTSCYMRLDNSFADLSGNALTGFSTTGVTFINSTQPWGTGYVANFDGSTSQIALAANDAFRFPGDFDIEFNVRVTAFPAVFGSFFNTCAASNSTAGVAIGILANGTIQFANQTNSWVVTSSAITTNTWKHIKAGRSGSTMYLFIDGVPAGTWATGVTANFSDGTLGMGWGNFSTTQKFAGQIANLRVTKAARNTAVFTKPSAAFPTSAPTTYDPFYGNVSAFLRLNGNVTDASGNNLTVTNNNVTFVSNPNKFLPQCAYFNGTNASLVVASPGNATKTSGDFALGLWFNPANVTGTKPMFDTRSGSTGSATGFGLYLVGNQLRVDNNSIGGVVAACGTVTANTWNYVLLERIGSTVYLFLNGTVIGTGTSTTNFSDGILKIGEYSGTYFSGYMSEVQFTNGRARVAANNNQPAAALPAWGAIQTGTSTLTSVNFDAATSVTSVNGVAIVEDVNGVGITPGTDFVVRVSANGGTNWTVATVTDGGKASAANSNKKFMKFSATGLTAGTSVKYEFSTTTGKGQRWEDAAIAWSA